MTEPTIYVPLGLCVAYVAWRFFAPSFFMNRELARHARMDTQREHERARLMEALAALLARRYHARFLSR